MGKRATAAAASRQAQLCSPGLKRPIRKGKKTPCNIQAATLQIQIPSPRSKRPQRKRSICLRPCSAAAPQVRLRPPSSSLCWGDKRTGSRTTLGRRDDWSNLDDDPASFAERLLGVHLRIPSSLCWGAKRSRIAYDWRDWSGLDDGPVGLIGERLLAGDVADYVRFRAVCPQWRRSCADPREHAVLADRRFHPLHWIMLLHKWENLDAAAVPHCTRRQFLNVSTGQCIRVLVPELQDHGVFHVTAEGLLLLICKATQAVRVLNPLTRQMAELPALGNECCPGYIGSRLPAGAALVGDGDLMLHLDVAGIGGALAFARPGDSRWALVSAQLLKPTLFFAGHYYGVSSDDIMRLEYATTGGDDLPRLVVVAKLPKPIRGIENDTVHLVVNDGTLLLLYRKLRQIPFSDHESEFNKMNKRKYKVYRVDLDAGMAIPACLGGCAVFIGHYRSLSVSPQVFPMLSADAVYPGLDCDERGVNEQVDAYHVRDGSIESNGIQTGLVRPWRLIDCLAAYVSR